MSNLCLVPLGNQICAYIKHRAEVSIGVHNLMYDFVS